MQFNYILTTFVWSKLVASSVFWHLLSLINNCWLILVEPVHIMNSAIVYPLELGQFVFLRYNAIQSDTIWYNLITDPFYNFNAKSKIIRNSKNTSKIQRCQPLPQMKKRILTAHPSQTRQVSSSSSCASFFFCQPSSFPVEIATR